MDITSKLGPEEKPTDALKAVVKAAGLTQIALAQRLNISRLSANQLINGRRAITPAMAIKLESVTEVPAATWLARQMIYELRMERRKALNQQKAGDMPAPGESNVTEETGQDPKP